MSSQVTASWAKSPRSRLNIEKLDGNIVQKHGSSKQVGFKQLGHGVETGVHGIHDAKLAQRRLEDKQPEEKTNTDCLIKKQEKEYQTGWKIKTGNVLDSCNQKSIQQCMKSGVAKHLEDTTMSTYLVNRSSSSSAIGFKTPVDMLGFFGWLASIKQGMLELVMVKCIYLGYHKSIMGNKLWRSDDVTSKVVIYRNMDFNESGEYKKTFIGSGVGTCLTQVLHGFEFEVEPQGDHTFEVEPQEIVDQGTSLQEVQTQDLMDYQLARDREQHLACKLFGYREDINEAAFVVAVVEKIYAHEPWTFNNTVACEATKGLLAEAKGNVHGMEIVRDQSGDCDLEKNGKWSCIYAVGSQEYQMVCTRPDIASADVGMLDKFDHGLQTDVQREIWLKGLLTDSRYELRLVVGIATDALVKGGSRSEVPAQVEVVVYRHCELHNGLLRSQLHCELHNGLLRSKLFPQIFSILTVCFPILTHHLTLSQDFNTTCSLIRMGFSKFLIILFTLQALLAMTLAQANAPKTDLFREYIGAEFNNVKFSDVPINPNVEFHYLLSFAIDYTSSTSASPTNGNFNVFWDSDNLSPSQVSSIKSQHSNVKVGLSLGGDSVNGGSCYFSPSFVDSWVSNAVSSLTKIIQEYNLDGIDIDYEHFHVDPETFAECIGKL
nr:chitinase 2-like [Tanacetum cinerariifolium]